MFLVSYSHLSIQTSNYLERQHILNSKTHFPDENNEILVIYYVLLLTYRNKVFYLCNYYFCNYYFME